VETPSLLEKAGELSGAIRHGEWRIMEMYGSTDVQTYSCTEVLRYRSTVVQIHVAIERMVAVGFRKRDPSLNY
jgi:hypothetical protein